ncbi:MAG: Fe-S cluster assembly protein SufD [Candidatus Omnitrophica bacterium]|nr:Fe-S cluster assembly protein SufD [Candidatus Omnitrophota bacterium]
MNKQTHKLAFIEEFDDHVQSLNRQSPDWLTESRNQALGRMSSLSLPTKKEEDWKYTNIAPITQRAYRFFQETKPVDLACIQDYIHTDDITLIFVNGIFHPEESSFADLPPGLLIQPLSEIPTGDKTIQRIQQAFVTKQDDIFSALSDTLTYPGISVHLEAGTRVEKPIHIIHLTDSNANDTITTPRAIFSLNTGSEASIMQSYLSDGKPDVYFTNALTDIILNENASLHYSLVQNEGREAFHVGTTRVWQEESSNFNSFAVTSGGAIARHNINVIANGQGANTTLNGLYLAGGDQLVDHHTSINHHLAHGTSQQLYKGILTDNAHAVFNGKIYVHPEAQQTNSYQLNKNLMLGMGCHVDTKPQLEIYADDIKCSHGATIGQLNEAELFYLQTRGIPRASAIKMLAKGFANELLNKSADANVQDKINKIVEPWMKNLII